MTISNEIRNKTIFQAFKLVANEEGYREHAYRNHPDEPWTIGYGFTFWPSGRKVAPTDTMGRASAGSLLRDQILDRLDMVLSCIHDEVEPRLTANMLTALISIHHNLGHNQFSRSTFIRLINRGDLAGAADAFLMWKRGNTANDLLPRRKRERKLFLTPDTEGPQIEKNS